MTDMQVFAYRLGPIIDDELVEATDIGQELN
jgi:hypothetical protein